MALGTKLTGLCTLSLVAAVGCGGSTFSPADTSGSTNTSTSASALDAPNAGIDPNAAEAPSFSDPQMEALAPMESLLVSQVEPVDMTADAAKGAGATAYRIALVWGHLPQAHDADDSDPDPKPVNWTGSVSVDAGAIGLKRTLAFDANDRIDPRTSPTSLSFDSHTLPYVDGLLLRVIVPGGGTPTLHFTTAALTRDIDLSQLAAKVGGVQRLADDEDGLAWIGFPEDGCARGFVHGRWVKKHAAFGALRGVVSDSDGERIGHVRGLWGHAPKRDANVWFAKYIGNGGDAHGLAFGKYGDGVFGGYWATKDEADTDVGHVEGIYGDGFDKGDGRGVWLGRWSEKCGK